MKRKYLLGVLLFLFVFAFVIPVRATKTTKLKPIEDAYINDFFANDNYGASDYLGVGRIIISIRI